jgi:hypothetical protein
MMRDTTKRLLQMISTLVTVLAVAISSVFAACSCSHHLESSERDVSCHHGPAGSQSMKVETSYSAQIDERCICAPQAAKLSVKFEGLKLKKQPAGLPVSHTVRPRDVRATVTSLLIPSASSLYRLHFFGVDSSRGPPLA